MYDGTKILSAEEEEQLLVPTCHIRSIIGGGREVAIAAASGKQT
jgi:hypothetical protein